MIRNKFSQWFFLIVDWQQGETTDFNLVENQTANSSDIFHFHRFVKKKWFFFINQLNVIAMTRSQWKVNHHHTFQIGNCFYIDIMALKLLKYLTKQQVYNIDDINLYIT